MLGANFHSTFIPLRSYISEVLKIAAKNFTGGIDEISELTGIPTGQSSGKVEPMLSYAQGMGLIDIGKEMGGIKALSLTPLGRIIYLEDRNISEKYSQWLLHLHLCNPFNGASVWHYSFSKAFHSFQNQCTRSQLEDYLQHYISGKPNRAVGPMLNMYQESASFSATQCLVLDGETYTKNAVPLTEEYYRGYAAVFFLYWDLVNPNVQQIVRDEFEAETLFFQLTAWDLRVLDDVLENWALNNWISLDRQTEKLVITRMCETQDLISTIFDELI